MDTATKDLIQSEYAHLKSVFFNSAYFGPSPMSAKKLMTESMDRELDPSFYPYNEWMGISERIRVKLADFMQVSPDTVTHSTSASDIINIVANGYAFNKGDHVAAIDKDYPSNILPWMLAEKDRGITFDRIPLDGEVVPTAEWLEKKLHPNTKIFNMSWVTFDTGKRMDLVSIGKMLKSKNIMFVVDATQALGGMMISREELQYIDVLSCSSYKWMLGPYGHAFGYFSQHAQEKIAHHNGNWILSPTSKSVYNLLDYTIETLPGARKYDRGQAGNFLTNSCLEGSLDFFKKVGMDNVKKLSFETRDYFLNNFPKNKYNLVTPLENMGNIVCVRSTGEDSIKLEQELKRHNVDVSVRQGNVRISFHVFNTKSQAEKLIEALDH